MMPSIRVSHQIKGRVPSAIGKPVKELKENEKTIYYERMAFLIEIPKSLSFFTISSDSENESLSVFITKLR